jgi:hypothetical protein
VDRVPVEKKRDDRESSLLHLTFAYNTTGEEKIESDGHSQFLQKS